MRLLKRVPGNDLKLVLVNDDRPPLYAILSHTWSEGQEVTYNELVAGTGKDKTGYAKIVFCEVRDVQAFPISWAQSFRQSRWFTRGWTLQELLAPANVEFFSQGGKRLGSRVWLEREVHEIINIPINALRGQRLAEFSIAERMSWTDGRTTTFKEDSIYCLLGIFGVYLPPVYGEGEAYSETRLREEIQRRENGQGITRMQEGDL
ncbi:hypothetical protein LTR17_011409 [Elasticomyces elasticus]|nr:hypothetical protein LTR17_011409 [Elasticomyces elasticus]